MNIFYPELCIKFSNRDETCIKLNSVSENIILPGEGRNLNFHLFLTKLDSRRTRSVITIESNILTSSVHCFPLNEMNQIIVCRQFRDMFCSEYQLWLAPQSMFGLRLALNNFLLKPVFCTIARNIQDRMGKKFDTELKLFAHYCIAFHIWQTCIFGKDILNFKRLCLCVCLT